MIKKRSEIILPQAVDSIVKVSSGRGFKELKINSNQVGKKYGEFVVTKVPAI
jgi:ribosomal protein S19